MIRTLSTAAAVAQKRLMRREKYKKQSLLLFFFKEAKMLRPEARLGTVYASEIMIHALPIHPDYCKWPDHFCKFF
jgi:hypothetical protein